MSIKITFPDGAVREFENGITSLEVASSISKNLAKQVLAAEVDGVVTDIRIPIEKDCTLKLLTFDDEAGKKAFWHTTSHVMAQAVKRLYPTVKVAIGPAIDNGFYYDFDCEEAFTPESLTKIEKEMKKIIGENPKIIRYELSREDSLKKAQDANEIYKVELCEAIEEGEAISFYEQGEFWDLCAGPHIPAVSMIKSFKLLSIAGAYWRGDEKNKMLQRIYGISFPKQELLDEYIHIQEEAKKRDHRKLGKELDLFSIMEEGPGFPFFHPKGMILRNELENFWREEHQKRGYDEVKTPMILDSELWKRSGHWDNYHENMYFTTIDDRDFAIKPMNCPGGMLLFNRKVVSYKDLPMRVGELGNVHRHEKSGALHGLMRVRCFTQDDAHIFMTKDQIKDEILGVIQLADYFYSLFGFSYHVELSTMPEKHIGEEAEWEEATNKLIEALNAAGKDYVINEGDGAFYGPKIDFHLNDAIGRTWQCGTIQLDFQLPERFDASYIGPDGEKHRPIVIHRVVFGSIERFIGILTEHFAGAFPLWLNPVQVKILSVNEEYNAYCHEIADMLKELKIRVEVDDRNEKLGYKIREAQLAKIPYMFVVGAKEAQERTVTIRSRKTEEQKNLPIEEAAAMLVEEIKTKAM
ncbi:MAG: threonine--tRNA ligase [Anaerofustis stercorihominis]|nr:threonine--tRNA ligase [Anaerofustis stercorihominis]